MRLTLQYLACMSLMLHCCLCIIILLSDHVKKLLFRLQWAYGIKIKLDKGETFLYNNILLNKGQIFLYNNICSCNCKSFYEIALLRCYNYKTACTLFFPHELLRVFFQKYTCRILTISTDKNITSCY